MRTHGHHTMLVRPLEHTSITRSGNLKRIIPGNCRTSTRRRELSRVRLVKVRHSPPRIPRILHSHFVFLFNSRPYNPRFQHASANSPNLFCPNFESIYRRNTSHCRVTEGYMVRSCIGSCKQREWNAKCKARRRL